MYGRRFFGARFYGPRYFGAGGLITGTLTAELSAVAGLLADALPQKIINALPQMNVEGGLAADATVVIAPPVVQSIEERLYPDIKRMLTTNLNAGMELMVAQSSLVGRTATDRGVAETVTVSAPLVLVDGELRIDVDALKTLLGI